MDLPEEMIAKLQELLTQYGLSILGALAILVIGWIAAKLVRHIVKSMMTRAKVEQTIVSFTGTAVYAAAMAFVLIAALNTLGVQTASIIAAVGAAALAVGLALQGALANLAAGLMLIIFRPFRVGHYIKAAGEEGIVEHIEIFTTQLCTKDNRAVIVPNASLTSDNIINYTVKGVRRVDMVMGVSYEDDIKKVQKILLDILRSDERVLTDPEPCVEILEFADSSVNFAVRPWVKVNDYWDVFFSVNEQMKLRFDAEDVTIPFPQQDVHIIQDGAA